MRDELELLRQKKKSSSQSQMNSSMGNVCRNGHEGFGTADGEACKHVEVDSLVGDMNKWRK